MEEKIEDDFGVLVIRTRHFYGNASIRVSAGTTGRRGGDAGHGGASIFRIESIGGGEFRARVSDSHGGEIGGERLESSSGCLSVEIEAFGDCERNALIDALRYALHVLEEPGASGHAPEYISNTGPEEACVARLSY
jgi:hypothetical protein